MRALEVREKTVGPTHYRIAESLEACSRLFRRLGRDAEARDMKSRATELRERLP